MPRAQMTRRAARVKKESNPDQLSVPGNLNLDGNVL